MNRLLAAFAFLSTALLSTSAFACSVCFDATAETRWAFIGTTIFLSLLPLGIIGGFVWWFWRAARAASAEEG